jgi:cobalt-precorrin 5A hydrolase/precorrin-3B C17-methyltransferase
MARVSSSTPMAIVILGAGALDTARRIQTSFEQSRVHGLASRVNADIAYDDFGAHVRALYASGTPIVALC